jgi:putative polyhydroxyalkanoate system protein
MLGWMRCCEGPNNIGIILFPPTPMSDLNIQRDHSLGLDTARRLAQQWANQAEKKLDMKCTVVDGPDDSRVQFSRAGVTGDSVFSATSITITAKLGFLLRPFLGKIEEETCRMLDAALAKEASRLS